MYLSGKYKSNVRFSLLVMRFELGQTQSSDWIEIVNRGTQHFFTWSLDKYQLQPTAFLYNLKYIILVVINDEFQETNGQ